MSAGDVVVEAMRAMHVRGGEFARASTIVGTIETELKALEEMAAGAERSRRLNALRVLTRGVARDFELEGHPASRAWLGYVRGRIVKLLGE